jgi:hypothetical protein
LGASAPSLEAAGVVKGLGAAGVGDEKDERGVQLTRSLAFISTDSAFTTAALT